jgi:predicted acetyltransferase
VDFELRPITPDEIEAFTRADLTAFGERLDPARFELEWTHHELDRTLAAFDDGEIVGTGRLYSLEMTLPGGAVVPVAAVSWIAVLPTHRRRGILTAIMRRQLEDAAARGEPAAVLLAAEGTIYRRFGFGVATSTMAFTLERRHSAFLEPVASHGRVRLVDESEARKVLPEVFDRARRAQPGAVSRVDAWWPNEYFYVEKDEKGARFFAVHESSSGEVDGYASYVFLPRWEAGLNRARLDVWEVVATEPAARAALWRYLCDVDLVETISAEHVALDEPLRWLLAESRRMRVTRLGDWLWVRPVDVAALLGARRYAAEGRVVLDVADDGRPGAAAGRFALDGGPDGAECTRTTVDPDLALGVADLGAVSLGGVSFSALARAGLVEERTPGALARADSMFASEPAPFGMTWF